MTGKKRMLTRLAAVLLFAATLAGLGSVLRADTATAADTGFNIDDTAFVNPSYDSGVLYFWHEGLPDVDGLYDQNGNVREFPVLITWNSRYYLCIDSNFTDAVDASMNSYDNHPADWAYHVNSGPMLTPDHNLSMKDYPRIWPSCYLYTRCDYPSGLLISTGLDVDSLINLGEAVSMQKPAVPSLVPIDTEHDYWGIKLKDKDNSKRWSQYLCATLVTNEWVPESWGSDDGHLGRSWVSLRNEWWTHAHYLDKDYVYTGHRRIYDEDESTSYEYVEGPENRYWTIKEDSDGNCHFWTTGESQVSFERITGVTSGEVRQRVRDWFHASDLLRGHLSWNGSKLCLNARSFAYSDWKDRVNTVDNTQGFRVFYADPNIVSFYRESFEVVDGQVISLEGPVVLDEGCTVTVRSGGVLACSGWIINNGQILVEPGGMLIVQDRETATGDKQMGAITSVNIKAGTPNGRIACDGTMIVGKDCKVVGAGLYGLEFGEGAQVVNYGQLISENLTCYTDYTIENRGDSSAVFAGWGVTDSGYALTRSRITRQTYNARGTNEKTAVVSLPERNAVYGDGADRLYINPAKSVTRRQASMRGYVSGYVELFVPENDDNPELPDWVEIYYDKRYKTFFIEMDNVTYHYYEPVGRWVFVGADGGQTYGSYDLPGKDTEYPEKELPDGYRLATGVIVGQESPPDGLKYDYLEEVYWFWNEDETFCYYWESALQDYIYVDALNRYYRYEGPGGEPYNYNDMSIPTEIYGLLPAPITRYDRRLTTEGTGEPYFYDPNAKPKVVMEGDTCFVMAPDEEGTLVKYYWVRDVLSFYRKRGKMTYGTPIAMSDVDWNGYEVPFS